VDEPRSPDHRPSYCNPCAARPRASGYRLRCAGFTAKSAKNARRLSGNPDNLLTKAQEIT
jgi:hypothetical protein